MATKSNPVQLNPVLSVSSIALDNTKLPDYAADNYILWLVTWGNNSTVSSLTGGWSHQDAISSSGPGVSQSAVYKKAASSAESNPTLTLSGTPNCIIATGYVIKGADLTNFLDGGDGVGYKTAFSDTGTANTLTTGTLTPANDNALIFCVCGAKDESAVRFRQEDLNGDVLRNSNASLLTQVIGYKQQNTAATDGGWVAYIDAARRTSSLTIAIKDDGNNTRAKDGRTAVIRINWYGLLGAAHDGAWTSAAPSTMAGGNLGTMGINGVTVSTTNLAAPTTSTLVTGWGNGSVIATTEVAAVWSGKYHSFASIDASGTLFSVNWMSENSTALMGNDGLLVVFADGNNQWVAFQLSQKLGLLAADPRLSVIDLEYGTQFDASENYPGLGGAAIDRTDLTECGYLYLRNASGSGTRSFSVKDALLHPKSGYVLRGGSEDDPLTPSFASVAVNGWGYRNLVGRNVGSKEQVVSRFPITIGDGGTTPTYFNANGSSYEYPEAFDLSTQNTFNIPADALTLNVNAGSSDSMLFESCAVVAGQQQAFEIDAASSTSANYGFGGAAIKGWAFTDNAGIAIPNATYSYCDTVALKGNATNVTITNTTSTNAAASWDASGATADGCTIDGTGAAYAIELGTAVTAITLTDCDITAGSTNKVHVLKALTNVVATAFVSGTHYRISALGVGTDFTSFGASANTVGVNFTANRAGTGADGTGTADQAVKITISGSTSLVEADVATAGAPAWIASPQPTLSATGLANTRYLLWNRTTSAELDNTFVAGTAYSKVISSGASSGDVLDLYAFKEGYAEARATLIYSGANASFAVDQVVDAAIAYYRTQESITDYTTLTEFNFYSPDIYIQADDSDGENKLARLFIFYNGVLTTADGATYMRGGVTFNSAFDVVINRSVRAIAVDNVSVTYGLHFTDEDVIRVTTDDGTSWIAPPSAPGSIRYAFGVSPGQIETGVSGVTAQDIVDISDAAAAAVVADGKTLTVPKFLGLK